MNIRETLHKTAQRFPDKTAIIFKDKKVSFLQLYEHVLKLANALRKVGIGKSDKVAIFLPNDIEYVCAYLACFCLGAVGVPLDYMFKSDELISCLNHSEAKILLARENKDVFLPEIKNSVFSLKKIILCGTSNGDMVSLDEIMSNSDIDVPIEEIKDNDPALIMYTSGTTGKPKGILLNYKHLDGSPKAMEYFVDLTDKDVKLSALPLSHIAGLIYIQNCIVFGITLIIMERFNPYEFLKNISQYRVTCFHIVPAMYTAILSLKQIEKFDLSSLRWVVVFGAPSSPDILRRFHQYCPNAQLLNGWGMTETCPPNTVTPLGSGKIESVGKPAPHCEIKIFDENNQEVIIGNVGEIVIRGWVVMNSYYKDPDATQRSKPDEWFHTGDLGRFDEEGFLFIVGRKKEMIKVGGQIVYAPEVESALHTHEAVQEVAVVGVPDKLRGEVVKAFVVLKDNTKISLEDLKYFAREHLAHFKVPHSIEFKESLPKNRAGKIDKEFLKKEMCLP